MVDLATGFVARGLPTVVMNRRGYGGLPLADGAPIALFGFDEDLGFVKFRLRDIKWVAEREARLYSL